MIVAGSGDVVRELGCGLRCNLLRVSGFVSNM